MMESEQQTNLDAGVRRQDEFWLCVKAGDFNRERDSKAEHGAI